MYNCIKIDTMFDTIIINKVYLFDYQNIIC